MRRDACFNYKVKRVKSFEFNESSFLGLKVDIYQYLSGQLLTVQLHNSSREPDVTLANLGGHAGKQRRALHRCTLMWEEDFSQGQTEAGFSG